MDLYSKWWYNISNQFRYGMESWKYREHMQFYEGTYGGFHKWGGQNGWFIVENLTKMDDLGVYPLLRKPPYWAIFETKRLVGKIGRKIPCQALAFRSPAWRGQEPFRWGQQRWLRRPGGACFADARLGSFSGMISPIKAPFVVDFRMFIVENSSRSIHPYIISVCKWSINVKNP